jgi:hypothetical protein
VDDLAEVVKVLDLAGDRRVLFERGVGQRDVVGRDGAAVRAAADQDVSGLQRPVRAALDAAEFEQAPERAVDDGEERGGAGRLAAVADVARQRRRGPRVMGADEISLVPHLAGLDDRGPVARAGVGGAFLRADALEKFSDLLGAGVLGVADLERLDDEVGVGAQVVEPEFPPAVRRAGARHGHRPASAQLGDGLISSVDRHDGRRGARDRRATAHQ